MDRSGRVGGHRVPPVARARIGAHEPRAAGAHDPPAAGAAHDPLATLVARFTIALREDGPYRTPDAAEQADLADLAVAIADPAGHVRAQAVGTRLGLVPQIVDHHHVLRSDPDTERAWMLIAWSGGACSGRTPTVLVEVPHPRADLRTELVGLALLRRMPGAVLLQAGAHRRVAAPPGAQRTEAPADVSARPDSAFAVLADALVARERLPQVQFHGFAERPDRAFDVVASAGAASSGPLHAAVLRRLTATRERVLDGTDAACAGLTGVRNVQGRSAARHGTEFVHVELSRSVRRDVGRRDAVVAAVADAVIEVLGGGAGGSGPAGDPPYHRSP